MLSLDLGHLILGALAALGTWCSIERMVMFDDPANRATGIERPREGDDVRRQETR